MKKDNKNLSNEPFYSKYKKPEIAKTSEKTERSSDKKRPRTARSEKSFDKPFDREKRSFDKPYEKREERGSRPERGDKPAFKKPFDKPYDREKRSFDKPYEKREERGSRPERSFDKPFDKRNDRPRPERGDRPDFKKPFDKPYDREKRSFDKPYEKREERGDRPERSFDKPFDKRNDRPRPERGDRPDFKKPFDKPYDREKRSFDKPYEKREERGSRPERDDKRSFDKPYQERPRGAEQPADNEKRSRTDSGENRRVGEFKEAPRYDMRQAEERYNRKSKIEPKSDYDQIRLNKYIANAGICSRREADELIEAGQITVNGKVVNELGYKVAMGAVVKYGNRILNPEKMVYILVNKPKDYITTTDDPEGRHTVMELIAGACQERVYPVGRLDRNTTGLLLLTNDGELAEKLMHPSNEVHKIYQVEIDKPITTEDFEKIKEGLELEDGLIKPDDLALITPDAMVLGIEIHSGRNRIVRRIFESLGYEVLKLDRTVYAGLTKKEVPRGKWRFMNEKEVVKLKYLL